MNAAIIFSGDLEDALVQLDFTGKVWKNRENLFSSPETSIYSSPSNVEKLYNATGQFIDEIIEAQKGLKSFNIKKYPYYVTSDLPKNNEDISANSDFIRNPVASYNNLANDILIPDYIPQLSTKDDNTIKNLANINLLFDGIANSILQFDFTNAPDETIQFFNKCSSDINSMRNSLFILSATNDIDAITILEQTLRKFIDELSVYYSQPSNIETVEGVQKLKKTPDSETIQFVFINTYYAFSQVMKTIYEEESEVRNYFNATPQFTNSTEFSDDDKNLIHKKAILWVARADVHKQMFARNKDQHNILASSNAVEILHYQYLLALDQKICEYFDIPFQTTADIAENRSIPTNQTQLVTYLSDILTKKLDTVNSNSSIAKPYFAETKEIEGKKGKEQINLTIRLCFNNDQPYFTVEMLNKKLNKYILLSVSESGSQMSYGFVGKSEGKPTPVVKGGMCYDNHPHRVAHILSILFN